MADKLAPPKPGDVVNGYRYLGGDFKSPTSYEPLRGEEFLKTLPMNMQNMAPLIKKYADGDMPIPTRAALSNPKVTQMMEMVAQYDPSFSAADYPSRAATRKDFTAGKSAANITSFNTVLQHLGKLAADAKALKNYDMPIANALTNTVASQFGDDRVNNFKLVKNAVVGELVRAFRGAGGARGDVEEWAETLDPNMSPRQLEGAVKRGIELLNGRIEAVGDQYNRGMKRQRDPVELLSPGARKIYTELKDKKIEEWNFDHEADAKGSSVPVATGKPVTPHDPLYRPPAGADDAAPMTKTIGGKTYIKRGKDWFVQ